MASSIDVTFSMYAKVNKYAISKDLHFVSTTSIESIESLMHDGEDRLILVQHKLENGVFLKAEYRVFVSFAKTTDVNSILEATYLSELMELFKQFSAICVYEAKGLMQVPSVYTDTGFKVVVTKVRQNIVSITQMKHNLNNLEIMVSGRIE